MAAFHLAGLPPSKIALPIQVTAEQLDAPGF